MHGHRPREPRIIGICEWCGEPLRSRDGHYERRGAPYRFHRQCWHLWLAERTERLDCAAFRLNGATGHHDIPEPPIYRELPGGEILEVVWHGAIRRRLGKGLLLID